MSLAKWILSCSAFLLFLVTTNASADVVTKCNGCTLTAYKTKAITAAGTQSQAIYVVDNTQKVIKKYAVLISNEPGSYVASAREVAVEPEVSEFAQVTWHDRQELRLGYDTNVASVTDYMINLQTRGTVQERIRSTFFNFNNSLRFQLNNGILSAFELSQPAAVVFTFEDGSKITVSINFALSFNPNDNSMTVVITSMPSVMDSAFLWDDVANRWVAVPMSQSKFNGYDYSSRDQDVMRQLERMARHYGISITQQSLGTTGGKAIVCSRSNGSDGELVCTVRQY